MFLLIYTATIVPYTVCFYEESGTVGFAIDLLMDLSFTIDIILTFFTAIYLKNGRLEISRSAIALNYITGYFVLDVVTTFPYQLIEKFSLEDEAISGDQSQIKMLRILRIQRLYKLFRIFRLLKLFRLIKFS